MQLMNRYLMLCLIVQSIDLCGIVKNPSSIAASTFVQQQKLTASERQTTLQRLAASHVDGKNIIYEDGKLTVLLTGSTDLGQDKLLQSKALMGAAIMYWFCVALGLREKSVNDISLISMLACIAVFFSVVGVLQRWDCNRAASSDVSTRRYLMIDVDGITYFARTGITEMQRTQQRIKWDDILCVGRDFYAGTLFFSREAQPGFVITDSIFNPLNIHWVAGLCEGMLGIDTTAVSFDFSQ